MRYYILYPGNTEADTVNSTNQLGDASFKTFWAQRGFNILMNAVEQQHKDLDIRFIFSNAKTKIGKKSLTTYGKWCELFGFKYHCIQSTKKPFPDEWLKEIKAKKNAR